MAKIESNDSYLQDILKDKLYYQIPIYQRPYQWTKENCEKLLDDFFLIMKMTEKAIIFADH
ncbi:hypothetical protein Kazakh3194_02820 [Helicobacter pylori]